ncbi:MAG TPA: hypothetical protein VNO32_64065 [Candidatus Acidoferrum sp.]|jgi:hypothetical protein|nr:hypothetical protein [Candidatus Acidoferrum sp.]
MNLAKRKLAVDFTLAGFFAGFVESPMSTPTSIVLHLEGGPGLSLGM